jgi:DNA helicase-4
MSFLVRFMQNINSDLKIDTVQKFAEIIGDNNKLWNIICGRVVSRFDEKIKYEHSIHEIKGMQYYSQGRICEINVANFSELIIRVDYGKNFIFRYSKNQFIKKFNKLHPLICYQEIIDFIENEQSVKKLKLYLPVLLKSLKYQFKQNFINAYNFYKNECAKYISLNEYELEKLKYIQNWININSQSPADMEQAAAIGAVEGHIQVVARAGSGKTSTLVN